jgi:micrococcal nuclease
MGMLKLLFTLSVYLYVQDVTITRIVDGDTIKAKIAKTVDGPELTIRLASVDAPEKGQPFGMHATRYLEGTILNKTVTLSAFKNDMYGRTLGDLYLGTTKINTALVEQGYAWAYFPQQDYYLKVQAKAKKAKLGLWSISEQVPPWEYRKAKKIEALLKKK